VLLSSLPLLQQKRWSIDIGGEDYYTIDNVGLDCDEWEHDDVAEPVHFICKTTPNSLFGLNIGSIFSGVVFLEQFLS
jgi:hypothetical protein